MASQYIISKWLSIFQPESVKTSTSVEERAKSEFLLACVFVIVLSERILSFYQIFTQGPRGHILIDVLLLLVPIATLIIHKAGALELSYKTFVIGGITAGIIRRLTEGGLYSTILLFAAPTVAGTYFLLGGKWAIAAMIAMCLGLGYTEYQHSLGQISLLTAEQITNTLFRDYTISLLYIFFIMSVYSHILRSNRDDVKKKQAELYHSARMASLGELAGGVAHEINNPLAVIMGSAQYIEKVIEKNPNIDGISKAIQRIIDGTRRASKITKSLLAYSQGEGSGERKIVFTNDLLKTPLDIASEKFRSHDIELTVSGEGSPALCDSSQINQIVVNLLNNAFDAENNLKTSKWVTIELGTTEKEAFIRVSNSHAELTKNVSENLFAPFFTTKDIGSGTGLGLSISKTLAEGNKGRLEYAPINGHVSFLLTLPNQ